MIELNKNKLIPANTTAWGDITGKIEDQQDLVSMLSSYATESWVSDQGYLKSVPSTYATKSWVSDQGYLTEHQPLKTINSQSLVGTGNIVIEASIPDYYATKSWVSDQGYLTSETLPSDLATESWVESQGFATETWVSGQGYLTSVPEGYATESWVQLQGYISQVKTINSQSLVGTGNISFNTLTDSQMNGITPYLSVYSSTEIISGKYFNANGENSPASTPNSTNDNKKLFAIDDELYFIETSVSNTYWKLDWEHQSGWNWMPYTLSGYTFTTDTYLYKFDEMNGVLALLGEKAWDYTDPNNPVEKSVILAFDPQNGYVFQEGAETQGLIIDGNLVNIIKVNGHTYIVDTDNATVSTSQRGQYGEWLGFVIDPNVPLTYGEGVGTPITFYKYVFYYNGRCYFTNSGVLYTFDEIYDGLGNVTGLQINVSYDIPMEYINDISSAGCRMAEYDGILYAIGRYNVGKYENGSWSDIQGFSWSRTAGTMKNYGAKCRGVFFGYNSVGGNGYIAYWNPREAVIHTQYELDRDFENIDQRFQSLEGRVSALETNYGDALIQTQNILS